MDGITMDIRSLEAGRPVGAPRALAQSAFSTARSVAVRDSIARLLGSETEILQRVREWAEGEGAHAMDEAVALLNNARGRVIMTGMGKSGHIARKVAATFASLGIPSHFVHPGEASHGDLGMITDGDVVVAFSNSGNTAELGDVLAHTRRLTVPLIGVTMGRESRLARACDVCLLIPRMTEGCPLGLAPTSSTVAQLALGDALAAGLVVMRSFSPDCFRRLHPGGSLGAATSRVRDVMHAGDELPLVRRGESMAQALIAMSSHPFGVVGVVDNGGNLVGVVGRASIEECLAGNLMALTAGAAMMAPDLVFSGDELLAEAAAAIQEAGLPGAFVVDAAGVPVGVVSRRDLQR